MKSLTVISAAFYEDISKYQELSKSCERFGLNLYLYGVGEPMTTLADAKVNRLILEIEELDSAYFLVTDFSDSFVMTDEAEIMEKYFKFNSAIVASADRQEKDGDSHYPQCLFRDAYPKSDTKWRYCNSGGYIGSKQKILDLLKEMNSIKWQDKYKQYVPLYRLSDWNNDQFRMSIVHLTSNHQIKVDVGCDLFQTMNLALPGEMEW